MSQNIVSSSVQKSQFFEEFFEIKKAMRKQEKYFYMFLYHNYG